VVYTATPTFSPAAAASLGTPGTNTVSILSANPNFDLVADGAFSHSYFSRFSPTTSFLYTCGSNSTGSPIGISLQQVGFNGNRIMSGFISKVATLSSSSSPSSSTFFCSPITHFFNAGTATDYLFLSLPPTNVENVVSLDITSNIPGGGVSFSAFATANGGTAGIIVDGADPANQASSIYFTSLKSGAGACTISAGTPAGNVANPTNSGIGNVATALCAYKLTQNGLQ
jgi:hypothetical protein